MIGELLSIFLPAIDLSSVFLVLCIWVKLGIVVRCLGSLLQDLEYFLVWLCARLFLMESGRGLGLSSTVLCGLMSQEQEIFYCVKSKRFCLDFGFFSSMMKIGQSRIRFFHYDLVCVAKEEEECKEECPNS